MNIRNRLISLFIRFAALGVITAFLVIYVLSIAHLPTWFIRFEVEVGFVYVFVLFLEILFNAIDLRHGIKGYPAGVFMPLKLSLTIYAVLASSLYLSLTFSTIAGEKRPEGFTYAVILLLFAIIDWLFFDEKGTVRFSMALPYSIYPTFYMVFNIFRPIIFSNTPIYENGMEYPYAFLDPAVVPIPVTSVLVAVLVIVGAFFGAVVINNLLSGKYAKPRLN